MTRPGRLIVLNGVSSAGKTTLATAFRDERAAAGELWLLIGIDDVLSQLPVQFLDLGLPSGVGVRSRDGLWFEREGHTLRLRLGPAARALIGLYHGWVAAAARAGFDVIVDDCVVDRETRESWERALEGLDPVWVAVRCAPEIADRRERERGDRALGMASTQHATIHDGIEYALEIDTGVLTPAEAHLALQRGLGR